MWIFEVVVLTLLDRQKSGAAGQGVIRQLVFVSTQEGAKSNLSACCELLHVVVKIETEVWNSLLFIDQRFCRMNFPLVITQGVDSNVI